jgi:predicted amidohydrolase
MRLAIAQTIVREDPRDSAELQQSGRDVRRLMREAHKAGARVVHFTEGATCFPHKRIMSVDGPDQVGPADWDRFEWDVLRREFHETVKLAGELKLWTVLGSVHKLAPPSRPHNSLYVISERGSVITRYDERFLSHTKASYMYAPGAHPVTFEVDGVRFGCALGMEAHFPEVFSEYEKLDVDCVLLSTTGGTNDFAIEARAHAAVNKFWVSFAVPAQHTAPSGVASPRGEWVAQCTPGAPGMVVVETVEDEDVTKSRLWRREARYAATRRR